MRYVTRPLTSEARARIGAVRPVRSNFDTAWSGTLDLLDRELWNLGVRVEFVLQIDVTERDLRLDGEMRANARPASDSVAVAFESSKGPLLFATGKFDRWQDNVRAIALGLEALRKVDRYGITQSDEQYRGWQALPPGTPMPAAKMTVDEACRFIVASVPPPAHLADPLRLSTDPDLLTHWFRAASTELHPDKGGDVEQFRRLTDARDLLRGAT